MEDELTNTVDESWKAKSLIFKNLYKLFIEKRGQDIIDPEHHYWRCSSLAKRVQKAVLLSYAWSTSKGTSRFLYVLSVAASIIGSFKVSEKVFNNRYPFNILLPYYAQEGFNFLVNDALWKIRTGLASLINDANIVVINKNFETEIIELAKYIIDLSEEVLPKNMIIWFKQIYKDILEGVTLQVHTHKIMAAVTEFRDPSTKELLLSMETRNNLLADGVTRKAREYTSLLKKFERASAFIFSKKKNVQPSKFEEKQCFTLYEYPINDKTLIKQYRQGAKDLHPDKTGYDSKKFRIWHDCLENIQEYFKKFHSLNHESFDSKNATGDTTEDTTGDTTEGTPQREHYRGDTTEGTPQREHHRGDTDESFDRKNEDERSDRLAIMDSNRPKYRNIGQIRLKF